MTIFSQWRYVATAAFAILLATSGANAQSAGSAGSVSGTVVDSTGAVVPNATVEIRNPVSGYDRSTSTDTSGKFSFPNIPYNPYHLTVKAPDFAPYTHDVELRSSVP